MLLKSRPSNECRRWKRIQEALGYLPHYHQVGRVRKEVVFIPHEDDRRVWVVRCTITERILYFLKNGHPIKGDGRLVGPLVNRRRVVR